jgi:dienelactone hydrolase
MLSGLTAPVDAAKNLPVEKVEITVDAADSSVELVGYLYLPDADEHPNPPVVVLLHQRAKTHAIWESFAEDVVRRGIAAFAMDLRGYGWSIYDLKREKNRPKNTFYEGDFEAYPSDIDQLVNQALQEHADKLDTTSLGVIGAAIGANAGILWAENEPRVKYTALISPGLDFKGLRIAETVRNYGDRPLFIVASAQDVYAAQSCYLLSDVVDRVLEMEIYDGYLHGNSLINASGELQRRLFGDLETYLK